MLNIFIVFVLLVIVFIVAQKYIIKPNDSESYTYKTRTSVLTPAESTFYHALIAAVGDNGVVFTNIVMSKVISPYKISKKKDLFIAANKIAKNYFQFVVCDPRTFEPRAIIELDNGKTLNKGKAERERLLIQVCKSANIPLIGATVKYSYQVGRLRRLLAAHIDLIEQDKEVRFCKKCGSPMVVKIASYGEFKGRRFFTCSRQPHCNYTENYNVIYDDESDLSPEAEKDEFGPV